MGNWTGRTGLRIALIAGGLAIAQGASAETLRFLTPWDASSEGNYANAELFMNIVEEESGGDVTLQKFDNAVVPPFEQFEPVASGVFDIHYTNPAYHSGATVVGQIAETADSDPDVRRESGLWDKIDEAYQNRGVKLIALGSSTGYQFLVNEPIGEDGGLEGRKMRSNPAYDGPIRALGGSPVQLPVTEIYTALQKNLIDGTAYPAHGLTTARMHEVVDYMVRPMFGQGSSMILMNLDKFNEMTPEQQEMLLQAGRRFETEAYEQVSQIAAEDAKNMQENGVEITELGPEYADRIDQIYNEAVWARAAENGGEEAQALIDFVKENDLVFQGHGQ